MLVFCMYLIGVLSSWHFDLNVNLILSIYSVRPELTSVENGSHILIGIRLVRSKAL